jgi:hypothetical protein
MDNPIENFITVWGDSFLAHDVGPKLTCIEAEALASLFTSFGRADVAERWIEGHAEGDDDEDDSHYKGETE